MLRRWLIWGFALWATLLWLPQSFAQAVITYQGYLRQGGAPANGNYDFIFQLYDAAVMGNVVGNAVNINNKFVANGLFTVELNFGPAGVVWNGQPRWIQIQVRPAGNGNFVALTPRVRVHAAPYAWTPIGPAGGDLGMNYPNPMVTGIRGIPVAAPPAGGPPFGSILVKGGAFINFLLPGGDLGGDYIATLVKGIWGNPIADAVANPGVGQILFWNGVAWTTGSPGGDLIGNYPNPMVAGIRGRPVDPSIPQTGQVLKWNGVMWAPANDLTDGNFTLPFTGSAAVANGSTFQITNPATSGTAIALQGISASTTGVAILGEATAATGTNYGVYGRSASSSGYGLYGEATAATGTNYGVYGRSASSSGYGLYGEATATTGTNYGVYGRSASSSGYGLYGEATATTGTNAGVAGRSPSIDGYGVWGQSTNTAGGVGVYGTAVGSTGTGVYGNALASAGQNTGVLGRTDSPQGRGVVGLSAATTGVNYGVLGRAESANGWGVFANGRLGASGTKSFQIDHPLRPETHFLNHFCIEAPEPYNLYRGVVTLDSQGEAWVTLPDYFESINREASYHLTPIGAPMPNLHVAIEIQNNRFKIAGGAPGKKVSWEVKAIRNDPWVQRYGYETEPEKPKAWQGHYLHPELYGQPREQSIFFVPTQPSTPDHL
ncbi:MAG: hypothetical protein KatS3mg020_0085 [Fimbriimonadales bacterium]|nr:MAG: hypothetical protein KatS3mg020_0085 [Fimbriimonadales bacterium]